MDEAPWTSPRVVGMSWEPTGDPVESPWLRRREADLFPRLHSTFAPRLSGSERGLLPETTVVRSLCSKYGFGDADVIHEILSEKYVFSRHKFKS